MPPLPSLRSPYASGRGLKSSCFTSLRVTAQAVLANSLICGKDIPRMVDEQNRVGSAAGKTAALPTGTKNVFCSTACHF